MRDDTEAAVRALPVHLQRRMAHLVLRNWVIERHPLRPVSGLTMVVSWVARYNRRPDEASHPYELKIYSSSTLLTLLDQMVGVVEDMESHEFQERYGALV